MSFIYRDQEYYDNLPPWLRKMIRNCGFPISAIKVGERLKHIDIGDEKRARAEAEVAIREEVDAMRLHTMVIDELMARRR